MLEQFTAITELLRHFYSNINYHGMKQESKVGKIQAKLEERLTLLTNKKRDLQNNHSAEAGGKLVSYPAKFCFIHLCRIKKLFSSNQRSIRFI